MNPLLIIAGLGLGYLVLRSPKREPTRSGLLPIPIPPPKPGGLPPDNVRVVPQVGLVADLSTLVSSSPHGTPVQVAWEMLPGHPQAGARGSAPLPLLWVSPDRKFVAVLWTLDPALKIPLDAKPGDVLLALVKS